MTHGDRDEVTGARLPAGLLVGGELHNSSTSSPAAVRRALSRAQDLGAEVVLAPVSWETIEPEEGHFDFEVVDALVAEAAGRGIRLIPLWFGAWKNGLSTYAPSWVKTDAARFPRVRTRTGRIECLTPLSSELRAADARAFTAVAERLAAAGDVIAMIQLENEIGVLGDSRDRSGAAEAAFAASVPDAVLGAIAASTGRLHDAWAAAGSPASGSWAEVLGAEADEAFMAHAYAAHVEAVAQAGRAHYDGPYLVNAWLDVVPDTPAAHEQAADACDVPTGEAGAAMAGGAQPGDYPSGGPLPHVAPVWRAAAPSIAVLAPDIYAGDFDSVCERFRVASGALLIPEMRRDPLGVGQMHRAVGRHHAIGVSPFGIDSFEPGDPGYAHLEDAYRQLGAVARALEEQPHAERDGFVLSAEAPTDELVFDGVRFRVTAADPFGFLEPLYPAYGTVVRLRAHEFLAVGRGFALTPRLDDDEGGGTGFLDVAELDLVEREWQTVRRLNGDETAGGTALRFAPVRSAAQPQTTIPLDESGTGVVRFSLYRY